MSHAKVIVNPRARGGRTGNAWPQIGELLRQAGLSFDHVFTEGAGHGTAIAKEAVAKGYELVVAVGGDGTVNEVVNGLVDEEGRGQATLGIISTGTGGDLVRTLGIPRDYVHASHLLASPRGRAIDLGVVEYVSNNQRTRRFYINTAGLGFDAAVVERTRRFKAVGGTIPFVMGFLTAFITYSGKDVVLAIDGQRQEERDLLIMVNNGRYAGGGMKFTPNADPYDGLLDAVIVGDVGKIRLLWNFPRLYKGTHITHPKVRMRQARSVEVESVDRMLLQVDGELVGQAPASFKVLPAALAIAI